MVGGTISPPILRAAIRIVVPGSTSTEMLSIVTVSSFFSSAIFFNTGFPAFLYYPTATSNGSA
jgi:hypothetical protein